jgi:hypothetical protein
VLPTFTLISNPHKPKLDSIFIHGQKDRLGDNMSSYLEQVRCTIAKDYNSGCYGGFFVNITHQMKESSSPRLLWDCLPPFMRFKESIDIKIYGECSITAREIGKYISKMASKFDFGKSRHMLCIKDEETLIPVIAGNEAFLNRLSSQMSSYYKDKTFVVTAYTLNVE